jgi:hypothetical protein
MKRFALPVLLTLSIIVSTVPIANASVTPGAKCLKAGAKQTFKGKVFTCIKLGSKLYWNNGVKVVSPAAKPSPSPSQTPPPAQTPPKNVKDCDLVPTPQLISNLKVEWAQEDLVLTFDWDTKRKTEDCRFWPGNTIVQAANIITEFILIPNIGGYIVGQTPYGSFPVNNSLAQQKVILTESLNQKTNGIFTVDITEICIFSINKYYKKSEKVCSDKVPAYVLNLPVPVITVSPKG